MMTEYETLRAIVLVLWSFVVALVVTVALLVGRMIRERSRARARRVEPFNALPLEAENDR